MNRVDRFLDLYRQIEEAAIKEYELPQDGSAIRRLEGMHQFQEVRSELACCREVRNLLSHKSRIDGEYPVEPGENLIQVMKTVLEDIEKPLCAKDILVPRHKVLLRDWEDEVQPVLASMREQAHPRIPILRNNRVVGVFSENVLLRLFASNNSLQLPEKLTFREIGDFLKLDGHKKETYQFISLNTTIYRISDMFEKARQTDQRIGLLLVTEHGRSDEQLVGIITAWDVAAAITKE